MFQIECSLCHDRLEEPGGLFFSEPDSIGAVIKSHLCVRCTDTVEKLINGEFVCIEEHVLNELRERDFILRGLEK